jgi:hypothetical protein
MRISSLFFSSHGYEPVAPLSCRFGCPGLSATRGRGADLALNAPGVQGSAAPSDQEARGAQVERPTGRLEKGGKCMSERARRGDNRDQAMAGELGEAFGGAMDGTRLVGHAGWRRGVFRAADAVLHREFAMDFTTELCWRRRSFGRFNAATSPRGPFDATRFRCAGRSRLWDRQHPRDREYGDPQGS